MAERTRRWRSDERFEKSLAPHGDSLAREKVTEANLDADRRSAQGALLTAQQMAIEGMELPSLDLKTILPLNDTHERIFALHGELFKAQGFAPLTIWKTHRYAWLAHLATPPKNAAPVALDFSMLKNQHRSDALLLTNAGSTPKTISLQVSNPPRAAQANWLQAFSVAWTDNRQDIPVADANAVTEKNGAYEIEIPAGMTRKVWLTIDSSKLPVGDTGSTLQVRDGDAISSIPLKTSIEKIAMPTPRLSSGMWDYTDGDGNYGITPKNRDAAIALMRSHYVDTPWATPATLPRAGAQDFYAMGNLTKPLDFSRFDAWVARWPGVRNYFVFARAKTLLKNSLTIASCKTTGVLPAWEYSCCFAILKMDEVIYFPKLKLPKVADQLS